MNIYLAIDPGREKCGLAVLQEDGSVIERRRCESSALTDVVTELLSQHRPTACLVGNGTGS